MYYCYYYLACNSYSKIGDPPSLGLRHSTTSTLALAADTTGGRGCAGTSAESSH